MPRDKREFLLRWAYCAVWLVVLFLLLRFALPWLLPFLLAWAAAAAAEPLISRLRRGLRLKRSFLSAVLTLALGAAAVVLGTVVVSALVRQLLELLGQLPAWLAGLPAQGAALVARLENFGDFPTEGLSQYLEQALEKLGDSLAQAAVSASGALLRAATEAAKKLPRALLFCGTTALAIFFTIASYPQLRAFLYRQLPPEKRATLQSVKTGAAAALGKWLRAECLLIAVTFFQLLAGFLLLRQPYALLLSALIALIDALPVLGTGTVLLPWAAVCFIGGDVARGLALTALYLLVWLVHSFLEPKLMGKSGGLPPLAALLAMYVGFSALGVGGMVLGPVALLMVKQLHDRGVLRLWK